MPYSHATRLAATVLAVGLLGCGDRQEELWEFGPWGFSGTEYESDEQWRSPTWEDESWENQPLTLSDGSMTGSLGYLEVPHQRVELEGYTDDWGSWGYSEITSFVDLEQGSGMTALTIDGGIDALTPGQHRFSEYSDSYDAVHISAVGCSGESRYAWQWDITASEVIVDVIQVEDTDEEGEPIALTTIHYQAKFPPTDETPPASMAQVVEGDFTITH